MEKPEAHLESLNLNILFGNLEVRVISIVDVAPDGNWRVVNHCHSDYEFHIIPRGRGQIKIENQEFAVKGGEFYITGPGVMHEQRSDHDDPMEEYCLECEISAADDPPAPFASSPGEARLLRDTLSRPYCRAFADTAGISRLFETIYREAQEQAPGYYLKLQTLTVEILLEMFRTVASSQNMKCSYEVPQQSVSAFRIDRLIRFMETNYKMDISLDDASAVLFLSPRQINRLMNREFGQTFHRYLLRYRLSVAVKLLEKSSLPIEAVACESGFSSHYYMYQVFRHFGMDTPAEIRLAAQAGKRPSGS